MNLKTILSFLFPLICLSGFVFQVEQVSDLYFRFETTSKTVFQVKEVDYYQTMMYCPMSSDLFDRNRSKEYSISQEITTYGHSDIYKELAILTIKDILELTPSEADIIESCIVRRGRLETPTTMNRSECQEIFKVTKSVNGQRICYTFMPRSRANYSTGDVSSSQSYPNVVYYIYFNPIVSQSVAALFISSVMHPSASEYDLLDSRPYQAKVISRTLNESCFSISGESTDINRLPPPYDTKCTPGHHREKCYEDCLEKKLKQINRLPWSGFYKEAIDMKMLTGLDLENKTTLEFAEKSFKECHSLCKIKAECLTQFSRTIVHAFRTIYAFPFFGSMIPSLPHVSLYAVPFLNLIEYIVQLGSCFGIWFGLSIISINPVKMLRKKSNTNRLICHCHKRSFLLFFKRTRG